MAAVLMTAHTQVYWWPPMAAVLMTAHTQVYWWSPMAAVLMTAHTQVYWWPPVAAVLSSLLVASSFLVPVMKGSDYDGHICRTSSVLTRKRKVPGSNPACAEILLVSNHTSDLKIDTPVATLPGA